MLLEPHRRKTSTRVFCHRIPSIGVGGMRSKARARAKRPPLIRRKSLIFFFLAKTTPVQTHETIVSTNHKPSGELLLSCEKTHLVVEWILSHAHAWGAQYWRDEQGGASIRPGPLWKVGRADTSALVDIVLKILVQRARHAPALHALAWVLSQSSPQTDPLGQNNIPAMFRFGLEFDSASA